LREEAHISITINDPSPLLKCDKRERKLRKRLREIEKPEAKVRSQGENSINEEERKKVSDKSKVETSLVKNTAQPKDEIPSSNTDRACAYLHTDAEAANLFIQVDEVAR
jgi:small-conductance mechanosensitive channel